MKRHLKTNKKGFTLLEVLLATVILVIASTMIMNGFISVMIFGANNKGYAKSGEANYRLAMANVSHYATNTTQMDTISELTDNRYSTVTASFASGTPAGVSASDLNLVVDVTAYVDPNVGVRRSDGSAFSVGGDELDANTVVNNRFSFFYDFGDYIGADLETAGHIMRWGFTIHPTLGPTLGRDISGMSYNVLHSPTVVDGVVYTPIFNGNDNFVCYGHYGWYCFNADHDCSYRSRPYTPPTR